MRAAMDETKDETAAAAAARGVAPLSCPSWPQPSSDSGTKRKSPEKPSETAVEAAKRRYQERKKQEALEEAEQQAKKRRKVEA